MADIEEYREGSGITEVYARDIKFGSQAYKDRMERQNRPDHWKDYFPDLDWLKDQLDQIQATEHDYSDTFRPHHGAGWFLERMIAYHGMLKGSIKSGDAIQSAVNAAALIHLSVASQMKINWEAHALRGKKVADSAALTRCGSQAERVARVEQLVSERVRVTKAFAMVAVEQGVTAKAIETDYYKAKKKTS